MWEELTSPLLPGVLPTLPSARLSSLEALDVGAVEELCDDPQRSFSKSSSVPCGAPVVPHESRRPKKWRTGLRVYLALNSVGSQATPRTSTKSTQTRSIYQIQCDEYRSKATVFKCSWCNVVFPHEDSLRKHYKSMHHKGGRHQCRLCPYSTETRSCLSAHERTHSGYTPVTSRHHRCESLSVSEQN